MLTGTTRELLSVMDETGGLTTGQISRRAVIAYSVGNLRARSHAVRAWLIALKNDGYVELIDNKKPNCWKRTAAGTAALSQ